MVRVGAVAHIVRRRILMDDVAVLRRPFLPSKEIAKTR